MGTLPSKLLVLVLLFGIGLAACGRESVSVPTEQRNEPTPDTVEQSTTPGLDVTTPPDDVAEQPTPTPPPDPPAVPGAESAAEYRGVTLAFYSEDVGLSGELNALLIERFTADTGIIVNIIPRPQDATENYAAYEALFENQSTEIDVLMLDVIWPASFAEHLVDLNPALGEIAQEHFTGIVANNTINNRLVAMPWFANFGMLFYRTDLIEKYGFDGPPVTWDELEQMSQTIQEGERADGNTNFFGFVWQGAAYEGLTCDALEWISSHGGGTIIEEGVVTVNNPAALQSLERARGWVGTISPDAVVSFREEDSRNVFQNGNAAFMRNWPYAYAAGNEPGSPIQGVFDVAPIPRQEGAQHTGTVGGWQLGVSAYSQNPAAAIEFVRYMTSPEVQKWRAIVGSYVPTIRSASEDPVVIEALPFLGNLQEVVRVTRPSRETGIYYTETSRIFFEGVNAILNGDEDASTMLAQMEEELQAITDQAQQTSHRIPFPDQ